MFADDARRNSLILQQFADLIGIPRRKVNLEAPGFQLRNDGNEKGSVRRIVQVNPYFFRTAGGLAAVEVAGVISSVNSMIDLMRAGPG